MHSASLGGTQHHSALYQHLLIFTEPLRSLPSLPTMCNWRVEWMPHTIFYIWQQLLSLTTKLVPASPFGNPHIWVYSHWFLRHIPGSSKKSLTIFFHFLMEAPEWAGFTDVVYMSIWGIRHISSLQIHSIFNLYSGYACTSLLTFTWLGRWGKQMNEKENLSSESLIPHLLQSWGHNRPPSFF